ncbi:MAG: glycosyltransferase family 39 protein [Anaerolineae bacterium]|nr:glycosyltransferase family 39 protein [Anaerolineae bacterium]
MTTRTRRIAALLFCCALTLAIVAQYYFVRKRDYMWDGIVLYAIAVLLFLLVARQVEGRTREGGEGLFSFWDRAQSLARREPTRAAAVVFSIVVGFAGTRIVKGRPWTASYWDAFAIWIISCVSFLAAFVRLESVRRGLRKARETIAARRLETLTVVGLTIVAGLLRLIDLDGIPYILTGDEAEMGLEAIRVLDGQLRNMFATGWLSHPTLFFFLQAIFLKAFGINVMALRLLSAIAGVATIPAFYVFLRLFWGRRVSTMATALLTFYHFHIHYSRIGLNNPFDPLFALGVFYFLVKGLRSQRAVPFVVSGALLGLSQYFYMGARLVPFILAAFLLGGMIQERGFWRRHSLHLLIFVVSFLVVGMPLISFFIERPDCFMARIEWLGIFQSGWLEREIELTGRTTASILWQQALKSVLAFNYFTDPTFWYRPGIPLLTYPASILFVFGLAYSMYRCRERSYLLLNAWFWLALFFGAFYLENPPSSQRLVIMAPPVMALVALAIDRCLHYGQKVLRWRRSSAHLVGVALVTLLAFTDYTFYFHKYTPSGVFGGLNGEVGDGMGKYLRSLGPEYHCYFHGPPRMYYGFAMIPFLAQGVEGTDVIEPLRDRPTFVDPTKKAVFIFLPERRSELDAVRQAYPTGILREFRRQTGEILFVSYEAD